MQDSPDSIGAVWSRDGKGGRGAVLGGTGGRGALDVGLSWRISTALTHFFGHAAAAAAASPPLLQSTGLTMLLKDVY